MNFIKVVIGGKYINLNKTYLPEIKQTSYFCYSLQFTMQNRGTCCLKKCFNKERSKGILCAKISRNSIVNENALNSECSLMHYKGGPSNYLFQLFLTL